MKSRAQELEIPPLVQQSLELERQVQLLRMADELHAERCPCGDVSGEIPAFDLELALGDFERRLKVFFLAIDERLQEPRPVK